MLKFLSATVFACCAVVSACATSAAFVNDTPLTDSGTGGKDTSVGNDSGNQNQDSGSKPDTSTDTCMKAAPSNVCGVDPQCDCASNQTCDVDLVKADGSSACVMAGAMPAGSSCSTVADCAAGLTCIWKICRPYCGATGADKACPSGGTCIQLVDSAMKPVPNLLVCSIDCALDNPTSCPSPDGCIYRGGTTNATDCYPVGTSTTCSSTQPNCSPGNVCATLTGSDGGTSNKCLQWCNVSAPSCSGGKTCYSFTTKVIVGSTEYGACQ